MINILIKISYDGTGYSGFQIQNNALTIQELLEKSLEVIYKQPIRLIGAGRTDAGVHARGQAAVYQAPFEIDVDCIPNAINASLPPQVVVTGAKIVNEKFHPRYDAKRKVYSYTIDRSVYPQVFLSRYSWHLHGDLDIVALEDASKLFLGTHDFLLYQASGNQNEDTVRTIFDIIVSECFNSNILQIWYEGSGFLYRMVRQITGTLIRASRGLISPKNITDSLLVKDSMAVGPTAPAKGLCLENVIYD